MTEVNEVAAQRRRTWLFWLSSAAVLLAIVVVVLGAFTRLKGAGLGCPDWPGCYGHLMWPDSAAEVAHAEARFPDAPVEHDKTWPEMVHRYFAGSLGLMIFSILLLSLKWRRLQPSAIPVCLPFFLCLAVLIQAAFGMWTVTLKLWPQIVTAHLLGGFTTLSLLWLLSQRLSGWRWQDSSGALARLQPLALFALIVTIVQVCLGGWTSANYAALACPDLPTCHGMLWPPADYAQGFNVFQHVGPNYLGGLLDNHARTAIHFSHRLGALLVSITMVVLAVALWRSRYAPARALAGVLMAVLVVQISLGISNVYWALPLPIAVAHNAGGAVLILVLVTLNHRLRTRRPIGENP